MTSKWSIWGDSLNGQERKSVRCDSYSISCIEGIFVPIHGSFYSSVNKRNGFVLLPIMLGSFLIINTY